MVTNTPKKNMKSSKEEEQAAELSIITGIKRLGVDDCLKRLEDMCQSWRLYETTATFESQIISMFGALDVNFDDDLIDAVSTDRGYFGLREVNDKIKKSELEAMTLFHRLRELNLLPTKNDDNESHHDALKKITKILEMIFYTKKVVLSSYQAKIAVHQLAAEEGVVDLNPDIDSVLGSWNLRFRMVGDDVSQFQELLLYLLDCAMENGYRKQDGFLYEPIVIDGRNMHSYRQVYEIKEFVYSRLRKEISFEHWSKGTQNMKNISSAVEYLTNCHDTQLPVLHKSRGTYAFTNGVYIASEDRFHCFETSETPLSDSVVACKFFEMKFDNTEYDDWFDIPTPHLDSVMNHQQWPKEVQMWLLCLIGRVLYRTNEIDSWQVCPFFVGLAGTGKSLLVLKVIKQFFETVDVGILSNNIERKFGISAFYDKMLVCAPEIRNDLAIEQAEFQSIVSGEEISVAVKFQKAFLQEWDVPIVLAGNEVPGWADAGGSIQRRLVVFEFKQPVKEGDMKLSEKLYREMPNIIRKANKAYRYFADMYADKNIWTVLPEYFLDTRETIARSTNFIESFLSSEHVVLGEDSVVPFADFKSALKDYASSNSLHMKQLTAEAFRAPFAKYKVSILPQQTIVYNGRQMNTIFLKGVSIKTAMSEEVACVL
ncbi:ATPase [Acanthocystis turfacea Chlorella virus TN603.4.2]|nr:ATPase [Acanthocystis turfacea Chlorella virus TN603.4.2]